jgi:cytochrome c oxidase subunit II
VTRRRIRAGATAVGLAGATGVCVGCSTTFGMPPGATAQGQDTLDLWRVFVVAAFIVAGTVYGLILWSILRYRRQRSDAPTSLGRQFRANVPLEVLYTAIPIVIIVVLFVATVRTEDRVDAVTASPDLVLHVEAFDWGWRFAYEGQGVEITSPPSGEGVGGPTIALPVGETTRVVLTSNDVIHAFWVPGFLYKRDAIPGRVNMFDLTPTTTGTYDGKCAEFCGLNHAYMTFALRVVSATAFTDWLEQHRAAPGAA